jgi:hypothetical protein
MSACIGMSIGKAMREWLGEIGRASCSAKDAELRRKRRTPGCLNQTWVQRELASYETVLVGARKSLVTLYVDDVDDVHLWGCG